MPRLAACREQYGQSSNVWLGTGSGTRFTGPDWSVRIQADPNDVQTGLQPAASRASAYETVGAKAPASMATIASQREKSRIALRRLMYKL